VISAEDLPGIECTAASFLGGAPGTNADALVISTRIRSVRAVSRDPDRA
jgi:hypothetical protein